MKQPFLRPHGFLLLALLALLLLATTEAHSGESHKHQRPPHQNKNIPIHAREKRLHRYAVYLQHLEEHLNQREEYLRGRFCPLAEPSPAPRPARLCEYCTSSAGCENGLACRDRACQRLGDRPLRCTERESCGPGQARACRVMRPNDFAEPGVLNDPLVNRGFFLGKTDFIADCVMGKVRINCDRRDEICDKEFCLEMTLKECRDDKLFEGNLNGRDSDLCCVKAVPLDCFVRKVCRCVAA